MRKTIWAFVCLLAVLNAGAQNARGRILVPVRNELQAPIGNATIELVRAADSLLVRTSLTNKEGIAEFENVPFGKYFVRSTMNQNWPVYSPEIVLTEGNADLRLATIILQPRTSELGNVTVSAKKPFIQKLTDRIVVNVENSIVSAGSSALDVLERAPGVNIDQNDIISLRGKSGVTVMIDGKPTAMTGSDLANYLKSLPSATIERIEIITNPSAKYDAAGNSGIIDIRMKKDQRFGVNGTITAGYGQGIYPKANAGATVNYREKKVNLFGNYNYGYRVTLNHLILDRNFYENGVYNGGDLKDNYSKSPFFANTGRAGMDYFPSKNTIIGFVITGNFNTYRRNNLNGSEVVNPQYQKISTFQSLANNHDRSNNAVANINFKHSFDSTGKEITADADYGTYHSRSVSTNATTYRKLDGTPLQPDYVLDGNQDGQLIFKTVKVDYVNPLGRSSKWEAGVKTSFVSSDNDAKFFDMSSGSPVNDVNKTNHFIYHENNNAAYLNVSRALKKFDWQIGLRAEQTNITTDQKMGNLRFDSSYLELFPSAFINYKLTEKQALGVSVSRRIDRPGYSDVNPFLFLIDVTTYATGRPGLLPQFTWSYELNCTLSNFNLTLGYSRTTNSQNIAIAKFRDVFPNVPSDENVTVQIPINLESSDYFGLTVSAPIRITRWWNMINNGNFFYNHFNASLGSTRLDNGKPAADIRSSNTFSFRDGWGAELNANFNSGGRYGFMVVDPRWGLAAGVQKAVMKGRGTLRFNITDIFWTNLPRAVITYDNYIEKWHAYRETRVANLTFTYRFGNNKVQAARRRTTASEEERQRAGN